MANEGSTKPTYSELESCEHDYSLATCKCLKCGHEYGQAAPTDYLDKTYPAQELFSRGEVLGLMHAWAESREPEKLNNAPFDRTDDWEARQDAKKRAIAEAESDALAESSLSSPPEFLYTNRFPAEDSIRIDSAASPELLPTQLPPDE